MTIQQRPATFLNEAKVVVEVTTAYTLNNNVRRVDAFSAAQTPPVLSLPPNPVYGQRHRISASGSSPITVDGNGHTVAGGNTTIAAGISADYTFDSADEWVASGCASGLG